jgi:hypothetical protein
MPIEIAGFPFSLEKIFRTSSGTSAPNSFLLFGAARTRSHSTGADYAVVAFKANFELRRNRIASPLLTPNLGLWRSLPSIHTFSAS